MRNENMEYRPLNHMVCNKQVLIVFRFRFIRTYIGNSVIGINIIINNVSHSNMKYGLVVINLTYSYTAMYRLICSSHILFKIDKHLYKYHKILDSGLSPIYHTCFDNNDISDWIRKLRFWLWYFLQYLMIFLFLVSVYR